MGSDLGIQLIEKEIGFFSRVKADLLKEHRDQYVLIKGEEILGFFDSKSEAVNAGYRKLGNVPFLTKKIEEEETVYTLNSIVLDV